MEGYDPAPSTPNPSRGSPRVNPDCCECLSQEIGRWPPDSPGRPVLRSLSDAVPAGCFTFAMGARWTGESARLRQGNSLFDLGQNVVPTRVSHPA